MKLPPLNALRAFEAAARHSSFAKAAQEMNVSPGAISRHVRRLEEDLSLRLFERKPQGLRLTEVGRHFLPEVTDAFHRLAGAVDRARAKSDQIRVLIAPTFGVRWLIPRLPDFRKLHPSIRINAGICVGYEQFVDGEYDVGISQEWWLSDTDHEKRLLRYEQLTPVCAPSFLRKSRRLRKPSDLRGEVLLHAIDWTDWAAWLRAVGEEGVVAESGTVYPTSDGAARAALTGKGVAILDLSLFRYELDSGQLVAPFDFVLDDASRIVFVCPEGRFSEPSISTFFDWLQATLTAEL